MAEERTRVNGDKLGLLEWRWSTETGDARLLDAQNARPSVSGPVENAISENRRENHTSAKA